MRRPPLGETLGIAEVSLRPMQYEDLPLVSRWLDQPHVRRWWVADRSDMATLRIKYGPRIDGTEPTEMFVIAEGSRPVGFIQCYLIDDDPEWVRALSGVVETVDAAGLDYLIGEPDAVGRGLGAQAIRAFVPMVYTRWPVQTVVVSVQQANLPSWRALEYAGFTRVWSGQLESTDPSDAGPAFVYVHTKKSA